MATKKKASVPASAPELKPVYEYLAEVVRVLDGDTIEVFIEKDVGFDVVVRFKKQVRIVGIDAPEKFGRFLAHVWLGDVNLSEHMIQAGAAKAYSGGKRG